MFHVMFLIYKLTIFPSISQCGTLLSNPQPSLLNEDEADRGMFFNGPADDLKFGNSVKKKKTLNRK